MTDKKIDGKAEKRTAIEFNEAPGGVCGMAFEKMQHKAAIERGILAIDPGTDESGWVLFVGGEVELCGIDKNIDVIGMVESMRGNGMLLAVEMIASYGMPVGREVFETCVFIGRLLQCWGYPYRLVYRKDVKMHLCGTPRAKDGNIRQALMDKLGPQGTKKSPGPTYGVKSHAWAALGVAVTAAETKEEVVAS